MFSTFSHSWSLPLMMLLTQRSFLASAVHSNSKRSFARLASIMLDVRSFQSHTGNRPLRIACRLTRSVSFATLQLRASLTEYKRRLEAEQQNNKQLQERLVRLNSSSISEQTPCSCTLLLTPQSSTILPDCCSFN